MERGTALLLGGISGGERGIGAKMVAEGEMTSDARIALAIIVQLDPAKPGGVERAIAPPRQPIFPAPGIAQRRKRRAIASSAARCGATPSKSMTGLAGMPGMAVEPI